MKEEGEGGGSLVDEGAIGNKLVETFLNSRTTTKCYDCIMHYKRLFTILRKTQTVNKQ